jgi:hypothetical protein
MWQTWMAQMRQYFGLMYKGINSMAKILAAQPVLAHLFNRDHAPAQLQIRGLVHGSHATHANLFQNQVASSM